MTKPKLPYIRLRNKKLVIRVTEIEKNQINNLSKKMNISVSKIIRLIMYDLINRNKI